MLPMFSDCRSDIVFKLRSAVQLQLLPQSFQSGNVSFWGGIISTEMIQTHISHCVSNSSPVDMAGQAEATSARQKLQENGARVKTEGIAPVVVVANRPAQQTATTTQSCHVELVLSRKECLSISSR